MRIHAAVIFKGEDYVNQLNAGYKSVRKDAETIALEEVDPELYQLLINEN